MTSPRQDPLSEAPGTLADASDSSYELVTKEMCSGSDADTVSVTSTDAPLTDISASDDVMDKEVEDDQANHYIEVPPPPSSAVPDCVSESHLYSSVADSSMMFSGTETQASSEITFRTLEEDLYCADGSVLASGTIRLFESPSDMPKVLEEFNRQQLRLSIKMAMQDRMLPARPSYRILYIGQLDHWVGTDINSHIGAALNKTPSSSRFNIVRGSEWPGASSSRVQLERSGSELVVDHCIAPRLLSCCNRPLGLAIALSDGSELRVSLEGEVQSPTAATPDLVIFCHSGEAKLQESTRILRRALQKTDFPALDIAVVRPYTSEESAFKRGDLCLHIEGRDKEQVAFKTEKIIPIDLYAFLSLEPAQLNRHLAYLAMQHHKNKDDSFSQPGYPYLCPDLLNTVPGFSNALNPELNSRAWIDFVKMAFVIATLLLTMLYFRPDMSPSLDTACPNVDTPQAPAWTPPSAEAQTTPLPSKWTFITTVTSSYQPPAVSTPPPQAPKKLNRSQRGALAALGNGLWNFDVIRNDTELHLRPRRGLKEALAELEKVVNIRTDVLLTDLERNEEMLTRSWWSDDKSVYEMSHFWSKSLLPVRCRIRAMDGERVLGEQKIETVIGLSEEPSKWELFKAEIKDNINDRLAIAQKQAKEWSAQAREMVPPGGLKRVDNVRSNFDFACHGAQKAFGIVYEMAHDIVGAEKEVLQKRGRQLGEAITELKTFKETLSRELPPALERFTSYASAAGQTVAENVVESTRPWRTSPGLLRARQRAMKMRCKLERKIMEDPASCKQVKN